MLETARFFHQFAALLNAGIPVQQSLGMAGRDCSANLQRSLKEASLKVEAGHELADALKTRSPYFDTWTIALIRSAEYSGALAETFERLAIAAETQHRRQKLYNAVMVSAVIIAFAGVALLIALITRSTAFVFQPVFWVLVAIVAVGLLLKGHLSAIIGAGARQQFMATVPFLKGIAEARSLLYFTELELPLRCGVPLLQALELLRSHIPDVELQKSLTIASRQIQAGKTLSQSMTVKLPPLALQMLRTGEETGNVDAMLSKLAVYYESDLERKLKQLQATLQPLGILAAGALVLLIGMQAVTSMLKALPG
ncbi:type II secretion system F family protein [Stenomitos frigidus]|uniref:Bacterial type II secretion system protein F domain protein n=1 Tax=Stenomitos frigidus ULC18 TaxID=2107698 RepID=A0A2T1E9N4_9CYAN|nr:type II secretion system F family protein [Stenomitos frigidus]PSB29414.1 bacterial type II secretion system protein F domain protein [Stenomitos frigidus ULC18]